MTSAVYTIENECQDCYKCVRHCPVKAIRIVGGKASVIPESCVACGECVKVCPAHAKKIRSDLARLRQLLSSGAKLYASIAPSFVGYFQGITIGRLAAALRKIGFTGVSETAHGAEAVSAEVTRYLNENGDRPLVISSACPAAVSMVQKYFPDYAKCISPIPSPLRAHCRLLKEAYGSDIKVVFFGPCAAKKNEADTSPDEIALSVIFPVLEELLSEKGITLDAIQEEDALALGLAAEGRFYSVEGGMNDTLRDGKDNVRYLSVSGLDNLRRILSSPPPEKKTSRTVFLEVLACHGGCVNGPAMESGTHALQAIFDTDASAAIRLSADRAMQPQPLKAEYNPDEIIPPAPKEEEIIKALTRVGKFTKSDELNCGACGYNTCRDFAIAMLEGKAEEAMCHNYLRKNFERTSNALIKYIPAAVVIVDDNLEITECNRNFAQLVGATDIYDAIGNLNTLPIASYLEEFADLFIGAMRHGSEIEKYHQHLGERIVNVSVFPIAQGKVAGAVIQDVTKNEFRREQIAEKARDVIRKNVYTVQQVARLFGEHIAETEIMLNEIAGTYEAQTAPETHGTMPPGGYN